MSRSTKNRQTGKPGKPSATNRGQKAGRQRPSGQAHAIVRPKSVNSRTRTLVVSLLAAAAILIAVYTWTTPLRMRYLLKRSSLNDLISATRRDPNNSLALYYLGVRWVQLGQPASAVQSFRKAADLDNDDEGSWLGLAVAETNIASMREALGIASLFLHRHPSSASAHFTLSQIYDKMGNFQNAYSEAIAATAIDAKDSNAWRQAGHESELLGNNAQAETDFRRAIALDPRDWRSCMELGRLQEDEVLLRQASQAAPSEALPLLYLGKISLSQAQTPAQIGEAHSFLLRSAAIQPNNAEVEHQLGLSEMKLGNWAGARADLIQALQYAPADPGILSDLVAADKKLQNAAFLAQDSVHLKKLSTYLSQMQPRLKAVESGPFNAPAVLSLARLCSKNGDDLHAGQLYQGLIAHGAVATIVQKEADAVKKRAAAELSLPVTSPDPTAISKDEAALPTLLNDAASLFKQGQMDEAQVAYLSILLRDATQSQAYLGLGQVMKAKDEPSQERFYYGRAVDFSPRSWQAQFALADLDSELGLYQEMKQHYSAGLAVVPDSADGWHAYGLALGNVVDWFPDSADALQHAVNLQPNNAVFLRDLADMQVLLNKLSDAEANYRRALASSSNDPLTQTHLASFLIVNRATPQGFDEAGKLLQSADAASPGDHDISYWQGRLALAKGDAKDAIPSLTDAAENSHGKQAADAWYSLSQACKMTGDQAEAQQALKLSDSKRALDVYIQALQAQLVKDPHNFQEGLKLASLYSQDGDNQKAIKMYRQILAFAPDNKEAQTGLEKVNESSQAESPDSSESPTQ
jgi:tetratricopeptide (TPR) repeat protein